MNAFDFGKFVGVEKSAVGGATVAAGPLTRDGSWPRDYPETPKATPRQPYTPPPVHGITIHPFDPKLPPPAANTAVKVSAADPETHLKSPLGTPPSGVNPDAQYSSNFEGLMNQRPARVEGSPTAMNPVDTAHVIDASKTAQALVALVNQKVAMTKEAGGMARILSALGTLARTAPAAIGKTVASGGAAAKAINRGASNIVRGTGNLTSGAGHVLSGLGTVGGRLGRATQQLSGGVINAADAIPSRILGTNSGRVIRDIIQSLGHGGRAVGGVLSGTGAGLGAAGAGAQNLGKGLKHVSKMKYGVPTVAAAPIVAGGVMAGKEFMPNVDVQSPVYTRERYQPTTEYGFRNPIRISWDR